ncbi:GNAT domain-containing protein [Schizothecium vesticola]|uniref:GNAT domain-containing protein n=1 Tax=Schizothecium vesticola TaxID=314040 RepID=A0AA40F0Q1_9PEZI|nr:GNAT domain-containing protein [Schizothecium vesticola]
MAPFANPDFTPHLIPTPILPLSTDLPTVTTPRLLLRPLLPTDLASFHALRSQPEVMLNNPQGRPDASAEDSLRHLSPLLPPNNTKSFVFAVCFKETPSDLIGVGGCYNVERGYYGWPAVGYMFRREVWGQGVATEFLRGWMGLWRGLERRPATEREGMVHELSVVSLDEGREMLTAVVVEGNEGSRRVLEKCGFERFVVRLERDLRDQSKEVEVGGWGVVV